MSRVRLRQDEGSSLPELLVSMLILSVVIAATASLTIGFQQTNAQNIARQDQIDIARTASERMSKTVRTAVKPSQLTGCATAACDLDAFIAAGRFTMQFYGNLDNAGNAVGPRKISYVVASSGPNAGVLIEKVQVPDSTVLTATGYQFCDAEAAGASATCRAAVTTRRLATGVLTDTAQPLFRFFDNAGNEISPGASGLTLTQIEQILTVELTVRVRIPGPSAAGTTTYIQRVLLPNSQAVLRPGEAP